MASTRKSKKNSMATHVHSLNRVRMESRIKSEGKSSMQAKIKAQAAKQIMCVLEFFTLSSMCYLTTGVKRNQ